VSALNIDGYPGAMGFLPATFPQILPVRVFRIDLSTGELARGSDGLCIPCNPGEVGQIAGKIMKGKLHTSEYVVSVGSGKQHQQAAAIVLLTTSTLRW
jgi:hypothetical protein